MVVVILIFVGSFVWVLVLVFVIIVDVMFWVCDRFVLLRLVF